MVFSSHSFLLVFLPLCLLCYFVAPQRWRNGVLLAFSLLFYAYGAPRFVVALVASVVATFYLVRAMDRAPSPRARKVYCGVAVSLSLALLCYFKYANFFVENFNALLSFAGRQPIAWTQVLLPIGISFFSFQSISYVSDVYRGQSRPVNRLSEYMLYITMFPQLVAGPIVRYADIEHQLASRPVVWADCLEGFQRFVVGLAKKVLVADVLGRWVDASLVGDMSAVDTPTAWIVMLAYTMQIYFDFSGYSDMAIGLGRIFGFRFPENFDNPYNSSSITEFWRRWHITLGAFMRNYLYIPLGGNRKGTVRTYFNLWIVFLLSGLWHGASWNFVLWGAYHGFWLVLERMGLQSLLRRVGRVPSVLYAFVVVGVGFVLFRIEDIGQAFVFLGRLFVFDLSMPSVPAEVWVILAVALVCSFVALFSWGRTLQDRLYTLSESRRGTVLSWAAMLVVFFCCLSALGAADFSPFIYFRF